MPYFTHDCDHCKYLGSGEFRGSRVDVYRTCEDYSDYLYIMRFGNDGDYIAVGYENFTGNGEDLALNFCKEIEEGSSDPRNILSKLILERASLQTQLDKLNDKIDYWDQRVTDWISDYGK